jgi:hypothetical protein
MEVLKMKISTDQGVKEAIKSKKYFISKCYEPDEENAIEGYTYFISTGKGQNITFMSITKERADLWISLGADVLEL